MMMHPFTEMKLRQLLKKLIQSLWSLTKLIRLKDSTRIVQTLFMGGYISGPENWLSEGLPSLASVSLTVVEREYVGSLCLMLQKLKLLSKPRLTGYLVLEDRKSVV